MSERFYLPDELQPGPFTITGHEAHHMTNVLRLKAGDLVTLFNGNGHEYPARLESVHKNQIEAHLLEERMVQRERDRQLTIACPLPKGDRGQFLIEKLTELGVHTYIPLKTRRSVVHPGEGKMDKLERYVIEASKQCGRNVLMRIEPMCNWEELLTQHRSVKWLADMNGQSLNEMPIANDMIIVLGPEGGWTDEERDKARAAQWHFINLGPTILRLETAALAAATLAFSR
jgi:16S rRNA (uracil1498-N3)-methyltransferase